MGAVARRYSERKFGRPNGKAKGPKAESEILTPYAPAVLSNRKRRAHSGLMEKQILGTTGISEVI